MWVSRKEWKALWAHQIALQKDAYSLWSRIAKLEDSNEFLVFHEPSTIDGRFERVALKDAIKSILEHLNLRLEHVRQTRLKEK
jgi:hypothetical protein